MTTTTVQPPALGEVGGQRPKARSIDILLQKLLDSGGSDLHLQVGSVPRMRVHGRLVPVPGIGVLTDPVMERILLEDGLLTDRQGHIDTLLKTHELDTSYYMAEASRFRVNLFHQQGHLGAVLRVIPLVIPQFDTLGLPPVVAGFADLPRGLVLVTGQTGSGKSTSLASMVDLVNRKYAKHIMTLEDPIEFVHQSQGSLVNQREVGEDTESFAEGLKHVLRQDPDVILVGEMRDPETIATAITAAETGHLVFATLHTKSAKDTVSRVVDAFPAERQNQVRAMLAASLEAVVCQQLCERSDEPGRIVAVEIMVMNDAIRNLIREGKLESIPTVIQTTRDLGSQQLDWHLGELVRAGKITVETAQQTCNRPEELTKFMSGAETATRGTSPLRGSIYHGEN